MCNFGYEMRDWNSAPQHKSCGHFLEYCSLNGQMRFSIKDVEQWMWQEKNKTTSNHTLTSNVRFGSIRLISPHQLIISILVHLFMVTISVLWYGWNFFDDGPKIQASTWLLFIFDDSQFISSSIIIRLFTVVVVIIGGVWMLLLLLLLLFAVIGRYRWMYLEHDFVIICHT